MNVGPGMFGLDLGLAMPERAFRVMPFGDVVGVPGIPGDATVIAAQRLDEQVGRGPFWLLSFLCSFATSGTVGNRFPAVRVSSPAGRIVEARNNAAIAASSSQVISWFAGQAASLASGGDLPAFLPIPGGSVIALVQTGLVDAGDTSRDIRATLLDLGAIRIAQEESLSRMLSSLARALLPSETGVFVPPLAIEGPSSSGGTTPEQTDLGTVPLDAHTRGS